MTLSGVGMADAPPTVDEPPTAGSGSPTATAPTALEPAPIAAAPAPIAAAPAAPPTVVEVATLRPVTEHLGWKIDLDGFLQVDAVAYSQASVDDLDPATGATLNQESIYVRRALVRLQAHKDAMFGSVELQGDNVAGASARLLGAYVGYELPHVTLIAGLFQVPFGAEVPGNVRERVFLEVPTWAVALFPGNFDGGAMARGSFGLLRWAVALTDGAPSGDLQWRGRDPTSSYDVMGRLGAKIDGPRKLQVTAGVSGLTGTGLHPGIAPTKAQVVWVDENMDGIVEDNELQVIPATPGEPSQTFHHDAVGADATVRWCLRGLGDGAAFFEGAIGTNIDRGVIEADPIAASRDLREAGFDVGVVQAITPWAQAGVRYDRYNADRDASEREGVTLVQTNEIFSTLAVMAAARYRTGRLMVEYDLNRNPYGRADNGTPTTLAADRLTIRAQVEF